MSKTTRNSGAVATKAMGHAFAQIAYGHAKKLNHEHAKENFLRARDVAYAQSDPINKDLVLREIAYRQAECGYFLDSLKTIYEMEYNENRNWAISRLAFEHIKRGKRKEAKNLARMITDEIILCPLLADLADHEFTEGRFATATATILAARMKAMKIGIKSIREAALDSLDSIEKDMDSTLQTVSKRFEI